MRFTISGEFTVDDSRPPTPFRDDVDPLTIIKTVTLCVGGKPIVRSHARDDGVVVVERPDRYPKPELG